MADGQLAAPPGSTCGASSRSYANDYRISLRPDKHLIRIDEVVGYRFRPVNTDPSLAPAIGCLCCCS